MDDLVPVELSRVILRDKIKGLNDDQFVYLRERGGGRQFAIRIGYSEAFEIQCKLQGIRHPRPMTHDLIGNILAGLDCALERMVVTDLRNNTFYAVLALRLPGEDESRHVDCRPSDAIALAVQLRAPMFVAREVMDEVAS